MQSGKVGVVRIMEKAMVSSLRGARSERNADGRLPSTRMKRSHKISDSISEFWTIVSFTAKKSSRMLCTSEVSVMLRSSDGQLRGGAKDKRWR